MSLNLKTIISGMAGLAMCSSVIVASGADMSGILGSVGSLANTMMQGQQQQQQIQDQARERETAIMQQQQQVQATENSGRMSQFLQRMPQGQSGYPILDPFANGQYWNARGIQFQQSMQMAAMRSQAENEKTKAMIDAEFQQTQAMMQAVGGLMVQAGEQVSQMGQASAEARQSEQNEEYAREAAQNRSCEEGTCRVYREPVNGQCAQGELSPGGQCVIELPREASARAVELINQNSQEAQRASAIDRNACRQDAGRIYCQYADGTDRTFNSFADYEARVNNSSFTEEQTRQRARITRELEVVDSQYRDALDRCGASNSDCVTQAQDRRNARRESLQEEMDAIRPIRPELASTYNSEQAPSWAQDRAVASDTAASGMNQ